MKNIRKILYLSFLLLIFFKAISQTYWEAVEIPDSIDVFSIEVNSSGNVFLGTSESTGGGVYKSINTGNEWVFTGIENKTIYSLNINELDYIFAGSIKGLSDHSIFRSINNGQSWQGVYEGFFNVVSIESFYGGVLFATSGTGTYTNVIKSTNYGDTWEEVIIFPTNTEYPKDFAIKNMDTIFVGTTNFISGGGVYESVDGGDTWEHIGLSDHYVSSLAINSIGDLFAGSRGHNYLYEGGVYILPFGQSEWTNIKDNELVISMVINSEDEIYIGCSSLDLNYGGIRFSADNGLTWEDISLETMYDRDIESLVLGPEEHLYALEKNSPTPLYKSIEPTITSTNEKVYDENFTTYNYPNPFRLETTIFFTVKVDNPTDINISIYNSMGRKIKDVTFLDYCGGLQHVKFDAKGLSDGLYYCVINDSNIYISRKMVLLKK